MKPTHGGLKSKRVTFSLSIRLTLIDVEKVTLFIKSNLRAFRFFSKPFDVSRLYSGLDKTMEYIDGAYVDIFLYGDNAQQRIMLDDILYITRNNRKVELKTTLQSFTTRDSFDDLCQKMPPLFFYQVHKSFCVNLHYVKQYSYSELYLTDGTRIPVAPRKQASFHKLWFEYLRRR